MTTSAGGIAAYSTTGSFDQIAMALADAGWGVFADALPRSLANRLHTRSRALESYRLAAVGRDHDARINSFVRRDEIAWVKGTAAVEQAWLDWIEALRVHLNRTLLLGLTEFESHFAHYPSGSFYRRHIDAFRGGDNRIVSVVAYLNRHWAPTDGGELVLYDADLVELGRFAPELGTLAVYLSEDFPHEVRPTQRDRFSLAGWFRRRPLLPVDAPAPAEPTG